MEKRALNVVWDGVHKVTIKDEEKNVELILELFNAFDGEHMERRRMEMRELDTINDAFGNLALEKKIDKATIKCPSDMSLDYAIRHYAPRGGINTLNIKRYDFKLDGELNFELDCHFGFLAIYLDDKVYSTWGDNRKNRFVKDEDDRLERSMVSREFIQAMTTSNLLGKNYGYIKDAFSYTFRPEYQDRYVPIYDGSFASTCTSCIYDKETDIGKFRITNVAQGLFGMSEKTSLEITTDCDSENLKDRLIFLAANHTITAEAAVLKYEIDFVHERESDPAKKYPVQQIVIADGNIQKGCDIAKSINMIRPDEHKVNLIVKDQDYNISYKNLGKGKYFLGAKDLNTEDILLFGNENKEFIGKSQGKDVNLSDIPKELFEKLQEFCEKLSLPSEDLAAMKTQFDKAHRYNAQKLFPKDFKY